ncbi:MAG: sulfotransferase [Dongiaceae bacterium]
MQDTLPTWTERAALVYGARKAGTTLLLNLLDGSDALMAFPSEVKLKSLHRVPAGTHSRDTYLARSRVAEVDARRLSQDRYKALWAAVDPTAIAGKLCNLLRLDAWHVQQAAARAPLTPQLWCAKEVGGDTDAILDLWWRCFPDAPILFILRNPLMVTRAVLQDRRRKDRRLGIADIVRETADPMRVVAAQSRHLGDPRLLAIAYEDMVTDTPATMGRIAAFFGIPFDEILLRPTLFGEPIVVRTSSRSTTEVFQSSDDWRDGLTGRERFWVRVTAMLLGFLPRYSVDYAGLRRRLSQIDQR